MHKSVRTSVRLRAGVKKRLDDATPLIDKALYVPIPCHPQQGFYKKMQANARSASPHIPLTAREAASLVEQVLDVDYAATPDPEPDDALDSEDDRQSIDKLRQVLCFLRSAGPVLLTAAALDPVLYRGLKQAGVALSKAFLLG